MGLFRAAFDKIKTGLAKTRSGVAVVLGDQPLSPTLIKQLERELIQSDVGVKTAIELTKDIQAGWERGEIESTGDAREFLIEQLIAYFPQEDRTIHFEDRNVGPTVILVAGINGAGKTTSIAKMAKSLRDEGKTVMLAACDTFRAAAVHQLEVWAQRLGVTVVKGQQGGDPAAVAFDAVEAALARGVDVLLVDTAGRLHTQDPLMRQLTKIRSVLEKKLPGAPHEVILVLDATVGQNAVNQAVKFTEATEVTGLFLAKLDGTAKGGIVIAIREALNIPVKFVGLGETPDDVEAFEPEKFIRAMFEG